MKKLILLNLLALVTAFAAYSQNQPTYNELKSSKLLPNPSHYYFDTLNTLPLTKLENDTLIFNQFNKRKDNWELKPGENQLFRNHDNIQLIPNPEILYSIRIMEPSGNFPIQIYRPDSTKNYTLLIKEY